MKKILFILAIWSYKISSMIAKLLHKKGTATPAVPALKICPQILKIIASKIKKDIIVVCGTNGKTTTNNMLCSVLESKGYNVACNKIGANMPYGVAVSLIEKVSAFGKINIDYACLEVDEAYCTDIFKRFSPDYIVVTNLFRDQLDRYGEIDSTFKYLQNAVDMAKKAKLVINGDDPLCELLAEKCGKTPITYGIGEEIEFSVHMNEIKDSQFCGICGNKLIYRYYYYGQLGDYYCPKCGFKRPKLNYYATKLKIDNNIQFVLNDKQLIYTNYNGVYNVYNLLASISALKTIGIDISSINNILKNNQLPIGRMQKFHLKKDVILNLSKNPVGFTQGIASMLADKKTKNVVIMINDGSQDGTDISWLWDVDFEKIQNSKVNNLALAGTRRQDLAVRFKYAEVDKNNKTFNNLKDAIMDMLKQPSDEIYVLVNYTAIFEAQQILKKLEDKFKENI